MVNVIEIRVRATDETGPVYDKAKLDAAAAGRDSGAAYTSGFASHVRAAGGGDMGQSLATSLTSAFKSTSGSDLGTTVGDQISDSISDAVAKELPEKVEDPFRKSGTAGSVSFTSAFQGQLSQGLSSSGLSGIAQQGGQKFTASFSQGAKDGIRDANLGALIGDALGTGLGDAVPADVLGPDSPAGQKIRDGAQRTGKQAGKDAGDGFSPMLTTAIVGGLSVGAPLILGAFGAMTAGIAGVALKNNAVIKGDFTDLGNVADQAITQATAPLAGTMHQALVSVEGTVKTLAPELKGAFVNAEPDITAVANGVGALATNILPGLSSALKNSQVIVSDLGQGLGGLGSGVGGMFQGLTRDAYTTGAGMESLLDTTGHLASTLGTVLGSAASAGSTALMGLDDALNPTLSLVQRIANPATVGAATGLFAAFKLDPSISTGLTKAADGVETLALKSMEAGGLVGKMGGALSGTTTALEKSASVMGGPWGMAIGAGAGLVTGLVGSLINASHASDALTLSQQGLQAAISKDNGVAGEATAAYIAAQAQADGLAQSAQGAGVSLDTFTQAALGNSAAQATVTAAIEKANQAQRNQQLAAAQSAAQSTDGANSATADMKRLALANAETAASNNTLTDTNAKVLNSMKAQAAQTAAAIAQQQAYQDALNNITSSYTGFTGAMASGHAAMIANAQQSALNTVSALNLGTSTFTLGTQLYNSVSAYNAATTGAQGYSTVLTALNGTTMTVDQAQNTLAQDMLNAKTSFAQNKYSLDLNTQAGINNRESLTQAATAITNLGIAQYQATGDIGTANKTIQENIDKFVDATGATGKAKTVIEQYLEQLAKIPKSVTTNVKVNVNEAVSITALNDKLSQGKYEATGGAYGGAAATGGIRGNLVTVGERGAELVRMPFGSTVIPHSNLESMAATGNLGGGSARGGSGGGFEIHFSGNTDSAFATAFMNLVRTNKIQIKQKAIVP